MPTRRYLTPIAALFLLLLVGCITRYSDGPPPVDAEPGPALWAVSDEDTTIYLFGTVHALPREKSWFGGKIARAFAESEEMVTEIDLSDPAASGRALVAASALPEGQNLRQLMTPQNRMAFEEALVSLGLTVEALDRVEPWFAAMTLSLLPVVQAGYEQASGVEMSLAGRAEGKRHSALETIADQVQVFDGLPQETQLSFLERVVDGVGRAAPSLDAMVAQWLDGNAEQLSALMNAELTDPVLFDRLLIQRNANWAEWIERRLEEPGTVFVAVGAGHLAGRDSVQDHLKRRGLEVRRIWR